MDTDVLFATIEAGGGHVATARAMQDALELQFPGRYRTRVSDYMLELGLTRQDRQHKALWQWLLGRPPLIRTGQRLLDSVPAATRRWHQLTLDRFARLACEDLSRSGTRLVVANHGWLATGLTLAQTRYGLQSRVLIFATEPFDASALWAEPAASRVLTASQAARRDLIRLGLPASRVSVVGYPVARRFLQPAEPLPPASGLRVILSLGGEGRGPDPVPDVLRLLAAGHSVTVLAGRNEDLRQRLLALPDGSGSLRVLGFTDRVPELLADSHLVAGKAGPASVMESLAVGRPFLATGYAGLNELAVVRFLENRQLGGFTASAGGLLQAVNRYRDQPELIRQAAAECRRLGFSDMSRRLALALAGFLEDGEVPESAAGPGLDGDDCG